MNKLLEKMIYESSIEDAKIAITEKEEEKEEKKELTLQEKLKKRLKKN